jgi:hypothetical protein
MGVSVILYEGAFVVKDLDRTSLDLRTSVDFGMDFSRLRSWEGLG